LEDHYINKERLKKIIKDSHDMIYYISMLSTTGGKLKVPPKKILENKEWGNDLLSSAKVWKDEIIKNFNFPVQGDSHILSIIVGQEEKAIYLQKFLEENGFLAIAIRPPTVPVGQSRIRITIRRNLDFNLLNNFISVLKEFK